MVVYKSVVFLVVFLIFITIGKAEEKDGYKVGCVKCHALDENRINIHLVPHSHDDVGWLKTVDEYYYGLKNYITGNTIAVREIISTVVDELLKNPDRRYIQVETAFFNMWWQEQGEDRKNDFRKLVDNGQMEIVSAGWSMNDEACTNYQSTIDQFTIGLRKIEETLGKCGRPRVGWQIDPFGHSREQASIFVQLGFDGFFFSRLDQNDLFTRQVYNNMNFIWQGSANLNNSHIFGSIFPQNGYYEPTGFCWDILCSDDPIIDDPNNVNYNLDIKMMAFSSMMNLFSTYYAKDNKNILIPMGGDFQYQSAGFNFLNMDKLIKAFKNHSKYHIIYSTPSCYIKAVNDANVSLALKTDDFFPYGSSDHSYWGGYFTSRSTLKRFERDGHNILQSSFVYYLEILGLNWLDIIHFDSFILLSTSSEQGTVYGNASLATKQMYALSSLKNYSSQLDDLNESMGVLQHHDAVTGTEKQAVSNDYVRLLTASIRKAEEPIGEIIGDILQANENINLTLTSCLLTNISICSTSQNSEKFIVVVYNPLGWTITHYVRLPVNEGTFAINGPDGQEVYDLHRGISTFDWVDVKGETPSLFELIFAAREIPPMGFKTYHIEKIKKEVVKTNYKYKSDTSSFEIDPQTHLLKTVTLNNISLDISQNFWFYVSGDFYDPSMINSGAYIFRPKNNSPIELPAVVLESFHSGNLLVQSIQKWQNENADVYQSIRWYKNENYIEFNWMLGNINTSNPSEGKEFISRFRITNFDNQNVFYTDSNGRETIQRIKDKRSDYEYHANIEPVASNYYPITAKIVVQDKKQNIQVAVLTDRSQGGTSLEKDRLELMVHRRTVFDDNKGVGEALDETEYSLARGLYARGSHYLIIGKADGLNQNGKTTTAQERILAQKKLLQPWIGLSSTNMSFEEFKKSIKLQYSALKEDLPENVNILSFEQWTSNSYLIRLENIMEKNEDPNLSVTAKVNIMALFKGFNIKNITETTLGAIVTMDEYLKTPKYSWKIRDTNTITTSKQTKKDIEDGTISLDPMEIRTFIITVS